VASCAGLASLHEDAGTAGIFQKAEKIEYCPTKTSVKTESGTFELTAGDLLGFKAGDYEKQKSFGHVFIYIGNGLVMDSHGGSGGRSAGNSVSSQQLASICKLFPLRFVDR
jgi:cell wall-associated NlpC family hydrolase